MKTQYMFGRSSDEILTALRYYDSCKYKQETKMTRQEAVRKFFDIMYPDSYNSERDMKWSSRAIDAYEALGLIKFDKEERSNPVLIKNISEQWLQWTRNNIKLMQDGWALETQFMEDGSIRAFAKKDSEIIDITPDSWK